MNEHEYKELKRSIKEQQTYFKYVKVKLKASPSFSEEELSKYHKAYVKLSDSYEYPGSQLRIIIKTIIDSVLSPSDKYQKYKETIDQALQDYNTLYSSRPDKIINLKDF